MDEKCECGNEAIIKVTVTDMAGNVHEWNTYCFECGQAATLNYRTTTDGRGVWCLN